MIDTNESYRIYKQGNAYGYETSVTLRWTIGATTSEQIHKMLREMLIVTDNEARIEVARRIALDARTASAG